ncbi:hypothetical protein MXD61_15710 [Frankia sp. AgPm24]|uniref:hypothetical protein n=1 Tax=Frankia sp. AgPm24 TaxID=631128 RepID=UPI00200C16F2|nr:hypothetical protein [Frankia sp. AgPm24]MCK9923300.1 hypothetical protein [Frankia sp. AgPm24]
MVGAGQSARRTPPVALVGGEERDPVVLTTVPVASLCSPVLPAPSQARPTVVVTGSLGSGSVDGDAVTSRSLASAAAVGSPGPPLAASETWTRDAAAIRSGVQYRSTWVGLSVWVCSGDGTGADSDVRAVAMAGAPPPAPTRKPAVVNITASTDVVPLRRPANRG